VQIMIGAVLLSTLSVGMAGTMSFSCPTSLLTGKCQMSPVASCYRGNLEISGVGNIVLYSEPVSNARPINNASGSILLNNETSPGIYCKYTIDNQDVYLYAFASDNPALQQLFASYSITKTCPDSIASYLRLMKNVKVNCGSTCTLYAIGSCPSK
jgi:hypothetical protein